MQRADLSRKLGIRKSSVTSITAELVEDKFIIEQEPDSLRTPLALRTADTCAVVASVRSFEITAARVYLDGRLEAQRVWPFPPDASAERIFKTLEEAVARTFPRSSKQVIGVGVAEHGIVDPRAGVPLFASHLHQWHGIPVRDRLEKRFKIGTRVDNEMRCQLWATAWFDRALRDNRNLLYIGVVRGLGAALVMDGRIVLGRTFCAGEFGHVRAGNEGRVCSCGKTDCLETYVSMDAMEREIARVWPTKPIIGAAAIATAATDERIVLNVLDRLVARLAQTLCPIVAALDPDALVLGTHAPSLTTIVRELLRKHLRTSLAGLGAADIQIIEGSADSVATLRGMAGLVIDSCFRSGQRSLPLAREDAAKTASK